MMGIRNATRAVSDAAESVEQLADTARDDLSGVSAQLRTATQYAPYILIGTAIVAAIALILAIVAVSRD